MSFRLGRTRDRLEASGSTGWSIRGIILASIGAAGGWV